MKFIDWLYSFPMPDGTQSRTIWPGLIALIIIDIIIVCGLGAIAK